MPTYSVTVEMVPRDRTVVRVPRPLVLKVSPVFNDQPVTLDMTAVDVQLYPWDCESGAYGYAGWALVGDTLRGFVMDGPDAGLVRFDLAAKLDLLLWQLQYRGRHGLEIVAATEKADQERGKRRLEQAGKTMINHMRDYARIFGW